MATVLISTTTLGLGRLKSTLECGLSNDIVLRLVEPFWFLKCFVTITTSVPSSFKIVWKWDIHVCTTGTLRMNHLGVHDSVVQMKLFLQDKGICGSAWILLLRRQVG